MLTLINLSGLVIGIAVTLMMLVYVLHESSFENFQANRDRIYRVAVEWGSESNKMKMDGSMSALAPALNSAIPEIKSATHVRPVSKGRFKTASNIEFFIDDAYFCDPQFFEIFTVNITSGGNGARLNQPGSILLSESCAKKYFGKDNPVGEVLYYENQPLKINGVFADFPTNTHLRCAALIAWPTLKLLNRIAEQPWDTWGDDFTYFLLRNNSSVAPCAEKREKLLRDNAGENFASWMDFIIQPLADIHWNAELRGDIGPKGNRLYVSIFLAAAILVLLIASFNFMNLSTARYRVRMKEVGIRKVAGASRGQLVSQFLGESFLLTGLSLVIALGLFKIVAPRLYVWMNTMIEFDLVFLLKFWQLIVVLFLVVGFFAGSYPALLLSKFNPVETLKKNAGGTSLRLSFRFYSVIAQFTISIFLIICTLTIYRQLNFMQSGDLGFDRSGVVLLRFPFSPKEVRQHYDALHTAIQKTPGVISASGAYTAPGVSSQMNVGVQVAGQPEPVSLSVQALPVDFDYVKTMGLELQLGRDFDREHALDNRDCIILNETAVKTLALENPLTARIKVPHDGAFREMKVIGVVRDFPVQSLQKVIAPMLLYINADIFIVMVVKIAPAKPQQTIKALQSAWLSVLPGTEFKYEFLENAYGRLYQNEKRAGAMLLAFALLAITISCLGLLGLATFMISGRVKEIGVRKALGASVGSVVMLLCRDFLKIVGVAILIASPVAWIAMNSWLQNFTYRVDISLWIYAFAGTLALAIALLTVSVQAVRAAMANPIISLRYE